MTAASIAEARQAVSFLQTALPATHPGTAVFKFMNDVLEGLLGWPAVDVQPVRQRAARIARELATSVLRSGPDPAVRENLRLGHEDELCERFNVSRPVMRQAIRILEAQALVETRRGRGCGHNSGKPGACARAAQSSPHTSTRLPGPPGRAHIAHHEQPPVGKHALVIE